MNKSGSQAPCVGMDQNNSIKSNFEQSKISKTYHGDLEGDKESGDGGHRYDEDLERPPLRKVDTFCQAKCLCLPARYTIAMMSFMGFAIAYAQRTGFVSINWNMITNSQVKGQVDSSFYWGYLLAQVPGGFIAWKFSPTKTFGLSIVSSAVLNLIIPLCVMPLSNLYVLISLRVMQGFIEGISLPAYYGILRFWAPPMERSRLATLAICGSYGGVAIGQPLSRFLANEFGAQFYVYGIFGIIWYIFWLWLCFDDPHKHPGISRPELKYIERSLGESTSQLRVAPLTKTVLSKMMCSMPVYAVIVANFCRSWSFYMLVLYQPAFFYYKFAFRQDEAGFIGLLPFLIMMIIIPLSGMLADYLRQNGIMSTTIVRKLFTCGGLIIQGLCFVFVSFAHSSSAAMVALTCGTCFIGFAISGYYVNHLDIAPRYASILMGISNGIGTLAGVIVPYALDGLIQENPTGCWTVTFIIAACVHLFGGAFYAVFASGELQSWAKPYSCAPKATL